MTKVFYSLEQKIEILKEKQELICLHLLCFVPALI